MQDTSAASWTDILASAASSALSLSLAASLAVTSPALAHPTDAAAVSPPGAAYPEVSVLIKGQPVKDAKALLRYALPIDNKPIKEVQLPLELITEDLRLPGLKALDGVERVRPWCTSCNAPSLAC